MTWSPSRCRLGMTGPDRVSGLRIEIDAAAFEAVEAWAKSWFLDGGTDLLAFDGLPVGWALHIEDLEAGARVGASSAWPPTTRGRAHPRFVVEAHGLGSRGPSMGVAGDARGGRHPDSGHRVRLGAGDALRARWTACRRSALPRKTIIAAGGGPACSPGHGDVAATPAIPLLLELREQRRVLGPARHVASGPLGGCRIRASADRMVGERDLTDVALAAARPIVQRSGPRLAIEASSIVNALDAAAPRTVVLASDQHRVGRLVCHVARVAGIRSVVLQHGLPHSTLVYVPVVADHVLAWSDHAVEWFAAHGAPREKVSVSGNSRLDAPLGGDRVVKYRTGTGTEPRDGTPRFLAAFEPGAARGEFRRPGDGTGGLSTASPKATAVVKLHPGGSDWGPLRDRLRAADVPTERVRVAEREDIFSLIDWADVVLVDRSTVVVEALACGRPVVVVSAGDDGRLGDFESPGVGPATRANRYAASGYSPSAG